MGSSKTADNTDTPARPHRQHRELTGILNDQFRANFGPNANGAIRRSGLFSPGDIAAENAAAETGQENEEKQADEPDINTNMPVVESSTKFKSYLQVVRLV